MRHRYLCGHEVEFSVGSVPYQDCPVCQHNANATNPPPGFVYVPNATTITSSGTDWPPAPVPTATIPPDGPFQWLEDEIKQVRELAWR